MDGVSALSAEGTVAGPCARHTWLGGREPKRLGILNTFEGIGKARQSVPEASRGRRAGWSVDAYQVICRTPQGIELGRRERFPQLPMVGSLCERVSDCSQPDR
jgi:hypothetical protein